ncbi:MAG: hypothetical protein NDI94_02385 [Candidatus Woesearchaeota archaeon]|nr:hypothetical protein [Candidatus Woesearchaeota archaeon]
MLEKLVKLAGVGLAAGLVGIGAQHLMFEIPYSWELIGNTVSYMRHFSGVLAEISMFTCVAYGMYGMAKTIYNSPVAKYIENKQGTNAAIMASSFAALGLTYLAFKGMPYAAETLLGYQSKITEGLNLLSGLFTKFPVLPLYAAINLGIQISEKNSEETNRDDIALIAVSAINILARSGISIAWEYSQAFHDVYDGPARGYIQWDQLVADGIGVYAYIKTMKNLIQKN